MIELSDENIEVENNSIEDIEDYYILGLPIRTNLGDCHFLKVKDYPNFSQDLQVVGMTKDHFINLIYQSNNKEIVDEIKDFSLMQIVLGVMKEELLPIYERVFEHFLNRKDAFWSLIKEDEYGEAYFDEEEFEKIRQLILKLSCIKEEKINPNPEIQEAIDRSKRVKAQQGGEINFSTIVTSVSALGGKDYSEINEMTLYQLYMNFYRLMQKFSYDTTTLFATVGEVEIEDWNKKIDMFEEEKHGITRSEFSKIAGILND